MVFAPGDMGECEAKLIIPKLLIMIWVICLICGECVNDVTPFYNYVTLSPLNVFSFVT